LETHNCPKANEVINTAFNTSKGTLDLMNEYKDTIKEVITTYNLNNNLFDDPFGWMNILLDIIGANSDSKALGLHPATIHALYELADKMAPLHYYGNNSLDSYTYKLRA